MPQLRHQIHIARPVEQVFDYASTPARWPEWHPSSLRLEPGAEQPLPAGARFEEDISAGGRKAHLSWTVLECQRPHVWIAKAQADNGVTLRLEYRLTAEGGGTAFTRLLSYELPSLLLKLYNWVLGQRRIHRESVLSLHQLRDVLSQL